MTSNRQHMPYFLLAAIATVLLPSANSYAAIDSKAALDTAAKLALQSDWPAIC